jgi:cold shock CspA family protein
MATMSAQRCSTTRANRFSGCMPRRSARHQGLVKHIDRGKGYGFICCDEVHQQYGSDVFVRVADLVDYVIGDLVSFSLSESKQGQPQGAQLKFLEEYAKQEAGVGGSRKPTYTGNVKSFDGAHGYGFISCVETFKTYGRDVFVHKDQLGRFKVGDQVSFHVELNSAGHPKAFDVTASALNTTTQLIKHCQGGEEGPPSESPSLEKFAGSIKYVSDSKAYGFIECEALHKRFGCDVFFPLALLPGLAIGDNVEFQARVRNGQPQAFSLVHTDSAPETVAPVVEEVENPSSCELAKKLLRACSSSQKESYNRMLELLRAGADPNSRDVCGQTALMVCALNAGGSEKKCRLLVGMGANVFAIYKEGQTVLQWAKERISKKFAAYLEALSRGEQIDCVMTLHTMGGPSEV